VLSNHDIPRVRTRLESEPAARAAAMLLLTLRGTPFIYQGDELGLEDADVPEGHRVDPGGRDGCRAPIPWDGGRGHGWPGGEPWLPWPPKADVRNVAGERGDPGSMLHLYRRLLAARHGSPALRRGDVRLLAADGDVLAYERSCPGDRRMVLVNFGDRDAEIPVEGGWTVEIATAPAATGTRLPAGSALLLRPSET
jgi:alpha-glucosidase